VNEQLVIVPLDSRQVPLAPNPVGVLDRVTNVSDGLNPLPETTTVTPGGPETGLMEMDAVLVTWNEVEAESETVLPVAVTT
jgi:hypothetical protein